MTLMKSLLLGSAAGIVAIASAQAADLPTKKGAPAAEYVKVCNIGGTAGFTLPGSDTCLKISGYVTAQYVFGNLNTQYAGGVNGGTNARPGFGYSTRAQVNFDAVSNTANGPLLAHIEFQGNNGVGMDALGGFVINNAYIQWAGITAGKHGSFYDFFAGGDTWKDFFSPDHSGGPINMLAYTASFGGGTSATLSIEQPETVNGADVNGIAYVSQGIRAPDLILALDASQGWGSAHIAGVAHQGNSVGTNAYTAWGYGVNAGVKFNLPGMPGDTIGFQAAYAKGALGYSGVQSPSWGEGDVSGININGNGFLFQPSDAVQNANGSWSQTTAWTLAAQGQFKIGPSFEIDPEVAYGSYSQGIGQAGGFAGVGPNGYNGWWLGAVWDWTPVKNLDFALDTVYQSGSFTGASAAWTAVVPTSVNGFNARFRITRSF